MIRCRNSSTRRHRRWVCVYSAVVVGVTAFILVDLAVTGDTFSPIWPYFVTMPASLVTDLFLSVVGSATLIAMFAASVFQGRLIWRLLRGRKMQRRDFK
ncbi:SCO4225 family membrane protein [Spirillospora albida]|uniref:SCO4225 family membrane protein n=1 Tax=Spirillospora albida TaxID=58123 RepID=UPI0012F7BF63|nr:hypothetical protein [Spirillospora albida]